MATSLDLDAALADFKCYFKNLVGQVSSQVKLIQRLCEEFTLEYKIHFHRAIKADEARMDR